MSRKQELLEIEAEEPEMLHAILSKLPKPLNLEGLIARTIELREKHPPHKLAGRVWSRISASSVLKTTQDLEALRKQTLQDGERLFQQEAVEIQRREALKTRQQQLRALYLRHRRPAILTGAAVLVAVLGLIMGRSGMAPSLSRVGLVTALRQRALDMWQQHLER